MVMYHLVLGCLILIFVVLALCVGKAVSFIKDDDDLDV